MLPLLNECNIIYEGGVTTVLSFLNLPIICKIMTTPIYIMLITIAYCGSTTNPLPVDACSNPIAALCLSCLLSIFDLD